MFFHTPKWWQLCLDTKFTTVTFKVSNIKAPTSIKVSVFRWTVWQTYWDGEFVKPERFSSDCQHCHIIVSLLFILYKKVNKYVVVDCSVDCNQLLNILLKLGWILMSFMSLSVTATSSYVAPKSVSPNLRIHLEMYNGHVMTCQSMHSVKLRVIQGAVGSCQDMTPGYQCPTTLMKPGSIVHKVTYGHHPGPMTSGIVPVNHRSRYKANIFFDNFATNVLDISYNATLGKHVCLI